MSELQNIPADNAVIATTELEFLAFKIGQEEYGIDIQKVQELRRYELPTQMANAPDYLKGVVNLRGIIVPIIDMRIKFNLGVASYSDFTVVIILNIAGQSTGIVVDSVSDVITLLPEQIRPTPPLDITRESNYLIGIGALEARMLILVDIDKMMWPQELQAA
jgi:purine-binding chemotaxis protein CheW